jgi:DNA processing protein
MNELRPLPAPSFPDLAIDRESPLYPDGLTDLASDAPARLHLRGAAELLRHPCCVAIVGTRRATAYGLRVTRELGQGFARAGGCVVSGMAAGIDGMAHTAALDAGGPTVAVLGTGFDHVFPRSHRPLQREIASRGLLVSELESEDHGMKFTFLHRNRIIAALARVVIVVEAPERSGALNTANQAMELGRVVAAVPGPIDQPHSAGTNRLIADGAVAIPAVEDALMLAGLTPPPRVPRGQPDGDAGRVWRALSAGATDLDSLCARTNLPAARCMSAVTDLEIQGSIECAMTGVIRRR